MRTVRTLDCSSSTYIYPISSGLQSLKSLLLLSKTVLLSLIHQTSYRQSINNMAFAKIPDELFVKIFQKLPNGDKSSLASISLCNKRMHRVVEPLLYASFHPQSRPNFDNLIPFLRTLVTDQSKASFVKDLVVNTGWLGPSPTKTSYLTSAEEHKVHDVIRDVCNTTGMSARDWIFDLRDSVLDRSDAYIAILLAIVTNLKRLTIRFVEEGSHYNPYQIMTTSELLSHAGSEKKSHLPKLNTVQIKSIDQCRSYLPGSAIDIKTVHTIEMQGWNGWLDYPKSLATWIKTLHLDGYHYTHQSDFVAKYLITFFRYFPGFETLSLTGLLPFKTKKHLY